MSNIVGYIDVCMYVKFQTVGMGRENLMREQIDIHCTHYRSKLSKDHVSDVGQRPRPKGERPREKT